MEGFLCYSPQTNCDTTGLTMPIKDYPRSWGYSITGGYVYRGTRTPELYGAYIYADYVSGRIGALRYNGQTITEDVELLDSPYNIASFGEDENREIYVCSFNGKIYQIETPTSIRRGEGANEFPEKSYTLLQNFPNPFNPSTSFQFTVSTSQFISLKIFDVLGKEIATLVEKNLSPGTYTIPWNASNYPNGIYFGRIVAGGNETVEKFASFNAVVLEK